MEGGQGKKINRESEAWFPIRLPGRLGFRGQRGVTMHCIALRSLSAHSHTYPSSTKCCVSLHHGAFLAPLPPQDSFPLRPRLQDRELHGHHLPGILGAFFSFFSFFFSVQSPLPGRLAALGPTCRSVILHRLTTGWRGGPMLGAGTRAGICKWEARGGGEGGQNWGLVG